MIQDTELCIYRFFYKNPDTGEEKTFRFIERNGDPYSLGLLLKIKEAGMEDIPTEKMIAEKVSRQLHECLPEEYPKWLSAYSMFMGPSVKTNSLIIHIPGIKVYSMAKELKEAIDIVGESSYLSDEQREKVLDIGYYLLWLIPRHRFKPAALAQYEEEERAVETLRPVMEDIAETFSASISNTLMRNMSVRLYQSRDVLKFLREVAGHCKKAEDFSKEFAILSGASSPVREEKIDGKYQLVQIDNPKEKLEFLKKVISNIRNAYHGKSTRSDDFNTIFGRKTAKSFGLLCCILYDSFVPDYSALKFAPFCKLMADYIKPVSTANYRYTTLSGDACELYKTHQFIFNESFDIYIPALDERI